MLTHIAAFEARYQLRSPLFAVAFALFFLLTFGAVTMDEIQIGAKGNVNVNSPYAILQTVALLNVFAIFVITAFVANVVIRDDETGFAPIIRATRVGKFDYLVGRFAGAFGIAFLVSCSVPLAMWLGSLMPWLDPEKVGPTVALHYFYAQFLFALPTLLVMAAGFFALATLTRSMMWTYVGVVAFLVLYATSRLLLRDTGNDTAAALSDPFGVNAFLQATRYWTAADRNTRMPELGGLLLANRVLWLGIGGALFAAAYAWFRFDDRAQRGARKPAKASRPKAAEVAPRVVATLPAPRADAGTRWAQLAALTRFDMRFVFRSPAFFVLLAIGVFNAFGSLRTIIDVRGVQFFPVTRAVVDALSGSFSMIPTIIAIYYAGELVWRDRQMRMHDIVDATAAPAWSHLVPKVLAITGVLTATYGVGVLTGVLFQLALGYTKLEPMAYLLWFLVPGVITGLQLAVLSVFVQVLVPVKPAGWAVMLVYVVGTVTLNSLGYEHNLYNYGFTSPVPLSDMNGMGRFWIGRAWFQAYWLAFALMLGVLAYGLWRRGTQDALRPRLRALRQRLAGAPMAWLAGAGVAWLGLGGWIFYNTNVLNSYVPATEREAQLAAYEKALVHHADLPQPTVTDVTLAVDLFPRETRAVTRGSYRLENRSAAPIAEVHVRWELNLQMRELALDGATLEKDHGDFHYRIYRLATPMQPGEARTVRFETLLEERGFTNGQPLVRIVANGSFLDNSEITPYIGMERRALLQDRAKRRKHGLSPDLRMAKLEDDGARGHQYVRHDSDWVNADLTLTTDADQTPVAPGVALSDTVENGRRTLHSRTEAPIQHFFSVQSARYAMQKASVTGADGQPVALTVYHHPGHEHNVPLMLKSMQASIALFGERFGPYQFKQARIIEFPSYAGFAQAFAGTMPYSEAIGFVQDHRDDDKVDQVTYVTAHEMAHQWWAHQVIGADMQGSTLLSESFAQYSAMRVMEQMYGAPMMRKFLKVELDRYLRARGSEVIEELPLARVENQAYIHYEKGALAMWWAKEAMGADVVDRALQRLVRQYAFKPAPYPTSRDFLTLLREEAGPAHEQLITDLFEKITLYDMQASEATATKRPDGRYEVRFTVQGRKMHADGKGQETDAALDEPFELGAFSAEPGKKGFSAASVLAFERRRLGTGRTEVTLLTARAPTHVGVDPYNKRIDRNSEDNLTQVTLK